MKQIIGFCGEIEAGKSTAAKVLKKLYPKSEILPFAKALKELAIKLGWNGIKDTKGRKILQALGTDVCRNIDVDYWVKRWQEGYLEIMPYTDGLIIPDDMRFDNEAAHITGMGGIIIEIRCDIRKATVEASGHESENGIDPKYIYCNITNNGTEVDLAANLVNVLEYLKLK